MGEVDKTSDSKKRSDHRSVKTKVENRVVYFLRVEQGEYLSVKIGYSADGFEKRLAQHRKAGLGVVKPSIEVICVVKGTREDEQQIHRYFREYRVEGTTEEFQPVVEVEEYIRWLRDQYFVWVPDDVNCGEQAELRLVSPDLWMPRKERRKADTGALLYPPGSLTFSPRVLTQDDYFTAPIITAAAREAMAGIDLDPASHPVANMKVGAARIFTLEDNGLLQPWSGRVWLNPPFSQWEEWVPKIISEWQSGRVSEMCILCACRTLTAKYFRVIKDSCDAVAILSGRIALWGDKADDNLNDGHVIFYFGTNIESFAEAFSGIGSVFPSIKSYRRQTLKLPPKEGAA